MKLRIFSLEELDLVQLQILDPDENASEFSENTKFIESSVFSVFKSSFELSSPDFEYSRPNILDKKQVVSLRNHMLTSLARINSINNSEELELFVLQNISGIEFMDELKSTYPDWQIFWEKIRNKLAAINNELLEIIDACIDDDKIFWVKGY